MFLCVQYVNTTFSRGGHEEVARLLLEHGADVSVTDNDGASELHYASCLGHQTVAQLLMEYGAEVTTKDRHGATPICFAMSEGHDAISRLLIEHGAEAPARGDARMPLRFAFLARGVSRLLAWRGGDEQRHR